MLARWTSAHLLGATVGYWTVLAGATLGDAIGAIWRATHLPSGHGAVSASYANDLLTLTATESGRTLWTGSTTPGTFLLLVGAPPFLLVLAWLWARGRARRHGESRPSSGVTPADAPDAAARHPELGAGEASDWGPRPGRERESADASRSERAR